MQTFKGYVEEVTSRPGKFGMMHSVKVDNQQYGTKSVLPAVRQGDYVEFTAAQNAKGYWDADAKSFKVVASPTTIQTIPDSAPAASGKTKSWDPGYDKQAVIQLQSSRNSAIALVQLMSDSGALEPVLAKAKNAAAKVELVEMYVDKYTQRFQDDTARGAPPEHPVEEVKTKAPPKASAQGELDFDDELPAF